MTVTESASVELRTAQELAGHSTPLLTARYTHRRLHDLQGAVDKLPALVPDTAITVSRTKANRVPETQIPTSTLTDTDGVIVKKSVVPGVVTGDIPLHPFALMYTSGIVGETSNFATQPLEMKEVGAVQHRVAFVRTQVGDLGFEPRLTESESVVLPLHQSPIANHHPTL